MSKKIFKAILIISTAACLIIISACDKSSVSTGNSYSPEASGGDKTITISVMRNEPFFDLLKQKFEAAHPNIKVNFKEYNTTPVDKSSAGGISQIERDMMKFVDTISTELASGKGSDLLLTNYLPYKKYADKHLLANMDELMKNDPSFDRNNYYMNVFDAMKYKDGYYALPTSVQYTNIWIGNSALLGNGKVDDSKWSWQDFVNQVKPLIPAGGTALSNVPINNLLEMMLNLGSDQFIDTAHKKASFDSPEFINLLNLAKSMVDTKVASTDVDEGLSLFTAQGFFRYETDMITQPQTIFDGKGALYKAPSVIANQGYSFRSNFSLAINDKSKNKQEAWEFIKFVLSDEIQEDHAMRGMPVNKSAFHHIQDSMRDPNTFGKIDDFSITQSGDKKNGDTKGTVNGKEITLKPPTKAEVDRLETFITGINSVQETDNKLYSLVFDELAPFFSGQKSAEDAAKAIQSKVNTYLNE